MPSDQRSLGQRPFIRAGAYGWAFLGLALAAAAVATALGRLLVLVIPLLLAVFPAALLMPVTQRLKRWRLPDSLAALVTILLALGLVAGLVRVLMPVVAAELPNLAESFQEGVENLRNFLARGPFGLPPVELGTVLERAQDALAQLFRGNATEVLTAVVEGVTGFVLLLLALFFYLKDGAHIAGWIKSLFPQRMQGDAAAVGRRTWMVFGSYFRGQILIAFVDAFFIGIGLFLLQVPLALPLAVLVFFGGLFPLVGAFVSGSVAVLVALADRGLVVAALTLALIIAVQQVEGNVLEPLVLSRATELHPLAVITALAAGGILLGLFGAFIAVPVAASVARAVEHFRGGGERTPAPA